MLVKNMFTKISNNILMYKSSQDKMLHHILYSTVPTDESYRQIARRMFNAILGSFSKNINIYNSSLILRDQIKKNKAISLGVRG